jgi:hypothetical protein
MSMPSGACMPAAAAAALLIAACCCDCSLHTSQVLSCCPPLPPFLHHQQRGHSCCSRKTHQLTTSLTSLRATDAMSNACTFTTRQADACGCCQMYCRGLMVHNMSRLSFMPCCMWRRCCAACPLLIPLYCMSHANPKPFVASTGTHFALPCSFSALRQYCLSGGHVHHGGGG